MKAFIYTGGTINPSNITEHPKGDDLCMASLLRKKGIDFGEYTLGRKLKRSLIQMEFAQY